MVLSILLFLILAIEYSFCFKKNVVDTLPASCMTIIGVGYFLALFGLIKFVTLAIIFFVVVFGIFLIIKTKKKEEQIHVKNVMNISFLAFIILLGLMILITYSTNVYQWDEFSHWATTTKEMYYTGKLSIQESSTTGFKSYPPAMAIWQYYFANNTKNWNDWYIVFAYNIFLVVFMMPAFRRITLKNCYLIPFALIIVYIIPFLYESPWEASPWHCIYIDRSISILFSYGLWMYFSSSFDNNSKAYDNYSYFSIISSLSILSLLKSIGLAFAAFTSLVIIGDMFITKTKEIKYYLKVFFGFLFVCLINRTWSLKLLFANVSSNWNLSSIQLNQIIKLIIGNDESWRYEVISLFFKSLNSETMQWNKGVIQINMIGFTIIWFIYIYIYQLCLIKKKKIK